MMHHDPALCDLPVCAQCDAYGAGYSVGKAKAHLELRSLKLGPPHAEACGCEP